MNRWFIALLVFSFCIQLQAQNDSIPVLFHLDRLDVLNESGRENDRFVLLWKADKYASDAPLTVVQKKKYWHDDPHAYQSLAIYFWPDATRNDGRYTQRDGIINPEYQDYDYATLCVLAYKLLYFSSAFYLTHKEIYYDAISRQLRVWFVDPETRMNPDLEYSQVMPGWDNNEGRAEGIIDAYVFNNIIEAVRMVNCVKPLSTEVRDGVRLWFKEFGKWLNDSEKGKRAYGFAGNHAVNYDLIRYNVSLFCGDMQTCQKVEREFSRMRLRDQIDRQGKQHYELRRTRSFFYQVFNLTHIIDVSYLMKSNGYDLYRKNRRLIDRVFRYLHSFEGREEEYPYQELDSWDSLRQKMAHQAYRVNELVGKKKYSWGVHDNNAETLETFLQ